MSSMGAHKLIYRFLIKLYLMVGLIQVLLCVINVDGKPIRDVFYLEAPHSVPQSKSGDLNIYANSEEQWSDQYPEPDTGNLLSKVHDTK